MDHGNGTRATLVDAEAVGVDSPGTPGDDTIAGNAGVALFAGAGNAAGSVPGVDGEVTAAFNESLNGRGGRDTLVGDLLQGTSLTVVVGQGHFADAPGGSDARTFAFNDWLGGGADADTLVGDLLRRGNGPITVSVGAGDGRRGLYYGTGEQGDRAAAVAGNDRLVGGDGADVLVGDVLRLRGEGDTVVRAGAGQGGPSGRGSYGSAGGDDGTARAFNDRLSADTGADVLVGDLRREESVGRSSLLADAGMGGPGVFAKAGGDGNRTVAFCDSLHAGDGTDSLIGDALVELSFGGASLRATAGSGSPGGLFGVPAGEGGDDNSVRAFQDFLGGGEGDDTLVGDLSLRFTAGDMLLEASAGMGVESSSNYYEANGGSGNVVRAFGDELRGAAGRDLLVGDVAAAGSSDSIELRAAAGQGGAVLSQYSGFRAEGGDGGDDNRVSAFNDELWGGDDSDVLVGDLDLGGVTAAIRLAAVAGSGGAEANPADVESIGGTGGDGNSVVAFADTLNGNAGNDRLVGDVGAVTPVEILLSAGADPEGNPDGGGVNNVVRAFNDVLLGGSGNDHLIGDFDLSLQDVTIRIEGDADNTVDAFRDSLAGGTGKDTLNGDGDFSFAPGTLWPDLSIEGDVEGRDLLFADTLSGGSGADDIAGGLGADILSGGAGPDDFFWESADFYDVVAGTALGTPPIDVITDFGAGDQINLLWTRSLFGDFNNPPFIQDAFQLRREGGDSVLAIDLNGTVGGADFQDFVVLSGFTTDLTLQELWSQDVIEF